MKTFLALAHLTAAWAVTLKAAQLQEDVGAPTKHRAMRRLGQTCFKKVPLSFAQAAAMGQGNSRALRMGQHRYNGAMMARLPGTGMDPSTFEPFARIYKDGFSLAGCMQDRMFYEGDAHGDHRHSYLLGDVTNVSIVHYSKVVPKEDQKSMTHEVCFDFCRTLKNMTFFGLNNGRECYCSLYFEQVAGDSSQCTAPCDGNKAQFCGGKTKSFVFEMHACNDGPIVLGVQMVHAYNFKGLLEELLPKATAAAHGKQKIADDLQKILSKDGNPDASNLMQIAKVSAGKLLNAAQDAAAAKDKMEATLAVAMKMTGLTMSDLEKISIKRHGESEGGMEELIAAALEQIGGAAADFTTFEIAKKGDDTAAAMEKLSAAANEKLKFLQQLFIANEPEINNIFNVRAGSCVVDDDGCVMTSSLKDAGPLYENAEYCDIELPADGADIVVKDVDIDPFFDRLYLNGHWWTSKLDLDKCPESWCDLDHWKAITGPENAVKDSCYIGYDGEYEFSWWMGCSQEDEKETLKDVTHASGMIHWRTDWVVPLSGWKICAANNAETKDNAIQYYPLMYFVDQNYLESPTTCTGTIVGQPIYYKSVHSCAAACDAAVGECVGFSYYPDSALANNNGPNICFLFSSIKKATYYTGCGEEKRKPGFLQLQQPSNSSHPFAIEKDPDHPVCGLKLSKFVDTTIKPDPSGKCEGCLKTLTRADRCYRN
eukprot:TRINITY_DN3679_c0_g1_i1.p1 TRINITY_DN3679_c0_g1~~TRINITY_DN3679_c0_g1_i1.p1  ORF type:complete len:740 (+),score=176.42 TRINITY_DN3679_c0_g1_i1:92-2221(+)